MAEKKHSALSIINIVVIIALIIICLSFTVLYSIKNDYLMSVSSIIVIILPFLIYILEKVIKRTIPDGIKLSYLIFVFLSAGLGAIGDFYTIVTYYDKVVHFLSGILITFAFFVVINFYDKNIHRKKGFLFLNTIIFNTAIAAFWEICEFTFDLVFNKHVQKGLTDTMTDMITAIIGGIILSIILVNQLKKSKGIYKDKKLTKR